MTGKKYIDYPLRIVTLCFVVFILGCETPEKNKNHFDDLVDQEKVVIYLSKYNLDSVPKDIGKLRKVRSLSITKDSANGWTVYPPASALQERVKVPPFRRLPTEITELTDLQYLSLMELDLQTLPVNFDKLQRLDTLNLMLNKLTISNELLKLKTLTNLKYLGLFGNKVDSTDIAELRKANPRLVILSGIE